MCRIFAGQPRENYAFQTRSVRLGGHSTSIRLEATFWGVLDEVAESQGMSLAKFLTLLYDEVLDLHGKVRNFARLMNLLAFAFHTLCDLIAGPWRKARQRIGSRKRFFQHLGAITGYLLFPNWAALIRTLVDGEPPPEVLQA